MAIYQMREAGFRNVHWNYRFEKQGQALTRILGGLPCLIGALDTFAEPLMLRHLLLHVVPQYVDAMPQICPTGTEKKIQAINVVGVMGE